MELTLWLLDGVWLNCICNGKYLTCTYIAMVAVLLHGKGKDMDPYWYYVACVCAKASAAEEDGLDRMGLLGSWKDSNCRMLPAFSTEP